jgi:hypothetical protein
LLQVLEQAPVPVLAGLLDPGSAPSRRVNLALQSWASLFAGSLIVLRMDATCYARTATALEVCILPTLQLWNRRRRLLHVEGASDLPAVTASLGTLAEPAPAWARARPEVDRGHRLTT